MTADLLDHPTISERYFFPRRAPLDDPFIVRRGDVELHCHRHLVDDDDHDDHEEAPMVLHFHGNGEVVADWADSWPRALAAGGVSSVLAEYRGYGGSSGVPQLGAMLADAVVVAKACGVPASRLIAYGRSVGSIYALHVASVLGLAGLVIESGIADVRQRLLLRLRPGELGASPEALDAAIAKDLDHRAKIAGFDGEVLVLHAAGDDLVDPEHGQTLARWAGAGARLRLFERGDHNSIHAYNGAEIIGEVIALVRRVTARA